MNSFYGGKEGRTYHIVQTYPSIEEMVNNFARGAAYPDVSYGQYVMIDTVSKNNPDNGRLYRRGINYSQELENPTPEHPGAGAIYIGQIVGPDGKVPKLSFVDISYIENHESEEKDIILFDEDRKDAVELDENDQIQENPIRIGYVNEFDEEEGKYAGKIGIDIPKSVVKIDAQIVPASYDSNLPISHSDIANNVSTFTIAQAAANPLHQHPSSVEAEEDGIEYYDYKLIIPVPSDFNIKADEAATYNRGQLNYPFNYILKYDTVENKSLVKKTMATDIEVPIRLDSQVTSNTAGSVITYTTNKGNTVILGNPNGQFHLYTWLEDQGDENHTPFSSVEEVINYLNNSEVYKYGIRIPINDNKYDLTQAGWLIAAQIYSEGSDFEPGKVGSAIVGVSKLEGKGGSGEATQKTCLFAFDYATEDNNTYPLNGLVDEVPEGSPQFKGWFLVQDFNSSLVNDPNRTILVGGWDWDVQEEDFKQLAENGLWFYGEESVAKWW